MKEYLLITGTDQKELVDFIAQKLKEGWVCQGGVSASAYTAFSSSADCLKTYYFYAQALVK